MGNGETHTVLHPECVLLMKTKLIVGYPEEDRSVHCALIHIDSIETLQPT